MSSRVCRLLPPASHCFVDPFLINNIVVFLNIVAFSRFTFGASKGAVQIVDIQGVGDIYTDPQARPARTQRPPATRPFRWPPPPSPSAPLQIHSLNGVDFGEGNLGVGGMALFFSTASYDGLCKLLKLPNFGACARPPSHHSPPLPCTDAMLGIASGW